MTNAARIDWRTLEDGTCEGASDRYDFAITVGGEGVILDVFELAKRDNDEAHIKSVLCKSVEEAKERAGRVNWLDNLKSTQVWRIIM